MVKYKLHPPSIEDKYGSMIIDCYNIRAEDMFENSLFYDREGNKKKSFGIYEIRRLRYLIEGSINKFISDKYLNKNKSEKSLREKAREALREIKTNDKKAYIKEVNKVVKNIFK